METRLIVAYSLIALMALGLTTLLAIAIRRRGRRRDRMRRKS